MLKRFAWMALFACAPLYAAPHLDDQRLQQLANDPFWISLGHYETAKLGGEEEFLVADIAAPAAEFGGFVVTLSLIHISEPTRPY